MYKHIITQQTNRAAHSCALSREGQHFCNAAEGNKYKNAQTLTKFIETTPPAGWRVKLQPADRGPSEKIRNSLANESSRINTDQSNSIRERTSNGTERIDKRNKVSTGSKT